MNERKEKLFHTEIRFLYTYIKDTSRFKIIYWNTVEVYEKEKIQQIFTVCINLLSNTIISKWSNILSNIVENQSTNLFSNSTNKRKSVKSYEFPYNKTWIDGIIFSVMKTTPISWQRRLKRKILHSKYYN